MYKKKIISFMETDEGYIDTNLSLPLLSEKLDIPKQYISEILNVHLNTNFQNFLNRYRTEAFIEELNSLKSFNLTFVGMASAVGFLDRRKKIENDPGRII